MHEVAGEHLMLLRRTRHPASIVTLIWLVSACALAQSSRAPEPKQKDAAAHRQQETADQLRAISSQLKTISEEHSRAEEHETTKEAAQGEPFGPSTWSNWVLASLAAVAAIIAALSLRAIQKQVVETQKTADAAIRSADIAARSLAITQRSYLKISGFTLAVGADETKVVFRLSADGPTHIDIEGGEIRISIDDPPLSSEDRRIGLYTAKIPPKRIVPRQQEVQMLQVAALPMIHQQRVLKGPPTEVFYAGTILYWDAFRDTGTPRHRLAFAYGVTEGQIRPLDMAIWARNNETDDPQTN